MTQPQQHPPSHASTCWLNAAASILVVAASCAVYSLIPHYRAQLAELYGWVGFSFTGTLFFVTAAVAYSLALLLYYAVEPSASVSKSLRFWVALADVVRRPRTAVWRQWSPEDRLAVRATLLKAFFGPMMLIILLRSGMGSLHHGQAILSGLGEAASFLSVFDRHGFWFTMQVIIFIDVAVFTVGYLVEMPRLGNQIRSVDGTWLGCGAALLCYYPFSSLTGQVLGRQVSDFPRFDDPATHLALNLALLALMAIYTSASVALGLKASNLTHRGVVGRGPYAFVRHPAYTCKNLAWWIGSVPVVSQAFAISLFAGVSALASVLGWTLLYVLRALTEEDHLKRVDGEYAAYAARVRWRFIPGVI